MKDLPCLARPQTATTPTGFFTWRRTAKASVPTMNLPVAVSYLTSSKGTPAIAESSSVRGSGFVVLHTMR